MYDLLGSPTDDESPAIDDEDATLDNLAAGVFDATVELPLLLNDSVENASLLLPEACLCGLIAETVRRRLKSRPDILDFYVSRVHCFMNVRSHHSPKLSEASWKALQLRCAI